jgi:hypothetical protein
VDQAPPTLLGAFFFFFANWRNSLGFSFSAVADWGTAAYARWVAIWRRLYGGKEKCPRQTDK